MRKENRKKGVSEVIGVILMITITVGLAAVVATFVYGYGGLLEQKPMPIFTVSRIDGASNVSVVLHDKAGAETIERLLVQSPDGVTRAGDLNATNLTGEIDVGTTLETVGVEAGDHYVVNATVDGANRVVIDRWI